MSDSTQMNPELDASGPREKKVVSKRGRRMLATALILLLILLLITSVILVGLMLPKGAADKGRLAGVTWIRSIYGFGPQPDQMISPASAAIDPEGGSFWVSDQGRFRMIRFDENGRFLEMFDGDRANGDSFDFPSRIAVAPDGWIYVAQSSYNNVKVYDENRRLQHVLDVPNPSSIAVNDEMVVVGAQSGFVAFDRKGKVIGFIGERGYGEDQFDTVNGVVLDEESNTYIVDSFNNRISKYDREGERIWMVKTGVPANQTKDSMAPGNKEELQKKYPAMMQTPMGATIDGAGRLVVIDLLDFSIAAFDPKDGKFLGKWGDFGREDGLFAYPADIDYDPRFDWFIVSDSGNERAQIIRLPGSGGGAMAGARRLLAGPLKACLFPLLLLLIMVVSWVVLRQRKKRRELAELQDPSTIEVEAA